MKEAHEAPGGETQDKAVCEYWVVGWSQKMSRSSEILNQSSRSLRHHFFSSFLVTLLWADNITISIWCHRSVTSCMYRHKREERVDLWRWQWDSETGKWQRDYFPKCKAASFFFLFLNHVIDLQEPVLVEMHFLLFIVLSVQSSDKLDLTLDQVIAESASSNQPPPACLLFFLTFLSL